MTLFNQQNKPAFPGEYRVCQTGVVGASTSGVVTSGLDVIFDLSSDLELNNAPTDMQVISAGVKMLRPGFLEVSGGARFYGSASRYEGAPVITLDGVPITTIDFNTIYHIVAAGSPAGARQAASVPPLNIVVKRDQVVGLQIRRAVGNTTTGTHSIADAILRVRLL